MAFTVEDIRDLVRILDERPEWRTEIRRLILDGELSAVHEQIAESRAATERRLDEINREIAELRATTERHTAEIAELRAATERHTAEIASRHRAAPRCGDRGLRATTERHTAEIAELRVAVERHTAEIAELRVAVERHGKEIAELRAATERHTLSIKALSVDVADLKGYGLEERYRRMAPAYFSNFMRRTRVMERHDHSRLVDDAESAGLLSDREASELLWLDLILRGRRKSSGEEVYLAVEVSWTIGESDVVRAARRAALLERIKSPALAAAAGKFLSEEVAAKARDENVWLFVEGTPYPPDRHDIGP